tara:strand:- start:132 stop:254 length:123 start_codon:yes stop_codon:yes gene_type:complete
MVALASICGVITPAPHFLKTKIEDIKGWKNDSKVSQILTI